MINKLQKNLMVLVRAIWNSLLKVQEIAKKNKAFLIMLLITILSTIITLCSLSFGLYYKYSSNCYKTRLEYSVQDRKILQEKYKELENKYEVIKKQTGLTYNYNTGGFDKIIEPERETNWNNVQLPEYNYNYEYRPTEFTTPKAIYYNTSYNDVNEDTNSKNKLDTLEKEINERRLIRLESKMNNYELEHDFEFFTGKSLYGF